MIKRICPPWTAEQVAALNRWQNAGYVHPFTCGNDSCREILVATEAGWKCPKCNYVQLWAHDFMLSLPPNPIEQLKN